MSRVKSKRNKDLVDLRDSYPEYWTWARLGDAYGIHRKTAQGIYQNHKSKK